MDVDVDMDRDTERTLTRKVTLTWMWIWTPGMDGYERYCVDDVTISLQDRMFKR
jgi:hypothetical protein